MIRHLLMLLVLLTSGLSYAQCTYLPQGILGAWSQDRMLWEREVSFEPVMVGQYPELTLDSFRITNLAKQSFLFEAGLREGDEVTAINSVNVSQLEAFQSLMIEISTLPEIILSLRDKDSIRFLNTQIESDLLCD
ncbi:hypothetical protein ACFOEK_08775 [Litoribrevibacter euphylliae]|uniref:PDZ domain-containing protein n=1 Tax=Litoribrevibacter euphylliae TaxID=1834034 RepID=A0ABV7HF84_9GAMM